jgi:hypothetical protein
MAYSSSSSTDPAVYDNYPSHCLWGNRGLPATSPYEKYLKTNRTNDVLDSEWDYVGLRDASALHHFQTEADYCFGYSDDSDDGVTIPRVSASLLSTPQWMDGALHSAHSSTAESVAEAQVPPNHAAQRARLDELEDAQRQLDDERAQLHQQLGQDPNPTPARARARDVQQRIINDNRDVVDSTPVFKRASQNLAAAASPQPLSRRYQILPRLKKERCISKSRFSSRLPLCSRQRAPLLDSGAHRVAGTPSHESLRCHHNSHDGPKKSTYQSRADWAPTVTHATPSRSGC